MVITQSLKSAYIVIDIERCKGCRYCLSVCPKNLITADNHLNKSGYTPAVAADANSECTGCLACATMCPEAAIAVYRRDGVSGK